MNGNDPVERFWRQLCADNTVREEVVEQIEDDASDSDPDFEDTPHTHPSLSWLHVDPPRTNHHHHSVAGSDLSPKGESQSATSQSQYPVYWLGEKHRGSHLYVRACYRKLYTRIAKHWNSNHWVLLLGSPGVGKSMFVCYLFYRITQLHVKKNQSFTIYLRNLSEGSMAFRKFTSIVRGTSRRSFYFQDAGSACDVDNLPDQHFAYCIADELEPPVHGHERENLRVIQICSFTRQKWKYFDTKSSPEMVFMSVLLRKEMLHLLKYAVIPSVPHCELPTEDEVKERFRKLGGSITNVLTLYQVPADVLIGRALQDLGYCDSMDQVLRAESILSETPSQLIHFRAIEDSRRSEYDDWRLVGSLPDRGYINEAFSSSDAQFASDYIRARVMQRFSESVFGYFEDLRKRNEVRSCDVRTHLYASYVQGRMLGPKSNMCAIRRLTEESAASTSVCESEKLAHPSQEKRIDLSCMEVFEFESLVELKAKDDLKSSTYSKPLNRSYGVVDFLIGNDVMGNMTLNSWMGIEIKNMLKLVKAFSYQANCKIGGRRDDAGNNQTPRIVKFYWIVPSQGLFDRMIQVPYVWEGRVVTVEEPLLSKPPSEATGASSGAAASSSSSSPSELTKDALKPDSALLASRMSFGGQRLTELNKLIQLEQFVVLMKPPFA